jgi:hypothetical protein
MTRVGGLAAILWAGVCAAAPPSQRAPLSHYHDLIAGAGEAGFQDGPFYRARFRGPAGLALISKPSRLIVSDRDNNRIRAVELDAENRVTTLAGSGEAGRRDGALESASFSGPTALAALSDRLLVVNDEGNALFRMIDLERRTVETLAGNGERGVEQGDAKTVPLGGVWNLVYAPAEGAIYFSQPEYHAIRRLNLKSRMVSTVVKDDPRIASPTALALDDGRLYVADRDGRVYLLQSTRAIKPSVPVALEEIGNGTNILALAISGGHIYAAQADPDSPWVDLRTRTSLILPPILEAETAVPYLRFEPNEPVGLLRDSRMDSSFFLTSASLNSVLCLKDYRFGGLSGTLTRSGAGLWDFEYPTRKPERTLRILILGDSRMYQFDLSNAQKELPASLQPARMATIPKRLELMLNTLAALDGLTTRYEVLSLNHGSWEPALLWPIYEAPQIVEKFDVDLVLLMVAPETNMLNTYFERPITAKGIPAQRVDPEYLLQPLESKLRGNPAADLLKRLQALGLARLSASGQVQIDGFRPLLAEPVSRELLLRLFERALRRLREALRAARPGGRVPAFFLVSFPLALRGSGALEWSFWKELCERAGVSWLDLIEPVTLLKETWFPISNQEGFGHFTPSGQALIAFVLAHELLHQDVIRWSRPAVVSPVESGRSFVRHVSPLVLIFATLVFLSILGRVAWRLSGARRSTARGASRDSVRQ